MPATPVRDPLMTAPTVSPYTPALIAGPFVFLSGQTGRDPETQKAGDTIEEQAEQALTNMRRLLGEAGADLGQVVSVTIFLARREDMPGMNSVYRRFFSEPYPTRATVIVNLGRPDSLIEMQAVAYTGD
jgi:2-iminobutanoate/2-iminopropanoate deaminase